MHNPGAQSAAGRHSRARGNPGSLTLFASELRLGILRADYAGFLEVGDFGFVIADALQHFGAVLAQRRRKPAKGWRRIGQTEGTTR